MAPLNALPTELPTQLIGRPNDFGPHLVGTVEGGILTPPEYPKKNALCHVMRENATRRVIVGGIVTPHH